MQRITVAKVERKPTKNGGTYTKITDEKGGTFSGFDEALARLQQGAVLDAEIQIEGKYANIKNYSVVGQPNLTPAQLPQQATAGQTEAITAIPAPKPTYKDNTESIERQVAIKEVGECLRYIPGEVPVGAKIGYWKWIAEKLGVSDLYEEKPEESHLVAEVKKMEAEVKVVKPTQSATKSQLDAIKKLSGKDAPAGLTMDTARQMIAELQKTKT
jgi:hypothetical protein